MKNLESFECTKVCKLSAEHIAELQGAVIFVGSQISVYHPTAVPSGGLFTEMLFSYIFNESDRRDLRLFDVYKKMPFEALMEICSNKEKGLAAIASLYSCDIANDLHLTLANQLIMKNISAIITPNYDLCFDKALGNNVNSIINHTDYELINDWSNHTVYFKIHGSADQDKKDSIIYTLRQEGILEDWKEQLLSELIKNKIVLFIGYSGRDFDICPLIAQQKLYRKIYWLHFSGDLSPYAYMLLKSKADNQIILGDMVCLLEKTYQTQIGPCERGAFKFSPKDYFQMTAVELFEWKINIFDRLGMPNLGLPMIENDKAIISEDYYLKMKSAFLAHEGRYREARLCALQRAGLKTNTERDRLQALVHAAGISIPLGKYFWLSRVQKQIKPLLNFNEIEMQDINAEFVRLSFAYQMRIYQIYQKIPLLRWLAEKAKSKAVDIYQKALPILGKSGSWDDRQMLQHNAERLDIPTERTKIALPSDVGFDNLGMPNMDIIRYRDFFRFGMQENQDEKLTKIDEYISRARYFGIKTEVWKLSKLKLVRSQANLSRYQIKRCLSAWRACLKNTQYVPILKIIYKIEYWVAMLKSQAALINRKYLPSAAFIRPRRE